MDKYELLVADDAKYPNVGYAVTCTTYTGTLEELLNLSILDNEFIDKVICFFKLGEIHKVDGLELQDKEKLYLWEVI